MHQSNFVEGRWGLNPFLANFTVSSSGIFGRRGLGVCFHSDILHQDMFSTGPSSNGAIVTAVEIEETGFAPEH